MPCGAQWDGQHLFYASNSTVHRRSNVSGIRPRVDPATGGIRWETGLGGSIEGSPSINSSGVIAAAAFSGPAGGARGTFLVDSSDGSIRAFLPTTALESPSRSSPEATCCSPMGESYRPTSPAQKGTRHLDRTQRRQRPMGVRSIPGECLLERRKRQMSCLRIPDLSKRHDDRHGSGRHDDLC